MLISVLFNFSSLNLTKYYIVTNVVTNVVNIESHEYMITKIINNIIE